MQRHVRRALRGIGLLAVSAALGVAFVAPADASTQPIVITDPVNLRPAPNTGQPPLAQMPAGARPDYICYADGENVHGTTKWFKVNWSGTVGFYSSIADDVPLARQSNIEGYYHIPRCGTGADINQGSAANQTVSLAPTTYNRAAAVDWALQNAQAIRPDRFADCTWFVSQALWAGGFRQTDEWNGQDHHGFPLWPVQGTTSATAAPDLVNYLVRNGVATSIPLTDGFSTNAIPEAQPGDIIAYSWNSVKGKKVTIDHLAFVVDIAPGSYPEVAEWGTVPIQEPYVKRGWTWSAKNHTWLQQEYHDVQASLIHIITPSY